MFLLHLHSEHNAVFPLITTTPINSSKVKIVDLITPDADIEY